MPWTPMHYPLAYVLRRVDKRLSLPALTVGAVLPDVEVPILILFFPTLPDHLVLHSLLGALTIGVAMGVLVTRLFYAPLMGRLFALDRQRLDRECRLSPMLVVSTVLGLLSHLGIDYLMHPFNPLLWPLVDPYSLPGPLVVLLAADGDLSIGFFNAALVTNSLMVIAWLTILFVERGPRLWTHLWVAPQSGYSKPLSVVTDAEATV